jgi:hypothetical protein
VYERAGVALPLDSRPSGGVWQLTDAVGTDSSAVARCSTSSYAFTDSFTNTECRVWR